MDKDIKKEEMEFEDWREPKSKAKTIVSILIVLILLEVLFYFGYFYFYQNTSYYINKNKEKLVTLTTQVFKEMNVDKVNSDEDVNVTGLLDVKSDGLAYTMDLDFINSPKKFIMSLGFDFKQDNNSILKGKLQLQDNNLIIDIKDLYKSFLKMPVNIDFQEDEDSDFSISLLSNYKDLEYLMTKLIEYHFEALEEGNLQVHLVGFNKKEYVLELGANEVINATKVLKKAVEKDEELSKIIRTYKIKNYNFIPTGKIKIVVNALNNELISADIATNGLTALIKKDNNKYIMEEADYTTYYWVEDNTIKIEGYENNTLDISMEYNNKDKNLIVNCYGEETINFSLKNRNDFNFHYKGGEEDYNLKLSISETKITGSMVGKVEGDNVDISIDLDIKKGNDLIERIDDSNIKNVSDLSEEEINKLYENLENIVNKISFKDIKEELGI